MLNFILAESALELVPKELKGSPAVASDSKRRGVEATSMLLDRSFHHSAMARLKDSEKRGRPDLVHVVLLAVTGMPLYLDGKVRIFVQTYGDMVLEVQEKTRIPKNYLRFRGLMEKVLVEKPAEGLVAVRKGGLRELVRSLSPDLVIGLSVQGRPAPMEELAVKIARARELCVIVGGFPRGHFTPITLSLVGELVRVDPRPMEAHVVVARMLYEVEKASKGIND